MPWGHSVADSAYPVQPAVGAARPGRGADAVSYAPCNPTGSPHARGHAGKPKPLRRQKDENTVSEATIAQPADETPSRSGPACEKCGFATSAAACPQCGWYPSLGIHVEIDQAYEAVTSVPAAADSPDAAESSAQTPEWQKHIEVWKDLIPTWGWVMIGTTLGVVAAAVAARVATLDAPSAQTAIGVTGLAGGLFAVLVLHVVAFVLGSSDNADFGLADVVIKPLKVWKAHLAELPEKLWLVNGANAALSTAASAALIVGGIPYDNLLDWGFVQPAKKSIVNLIAQQAAQNGDSDSLEDAVNDFAGQAGVGQLAGAEPDAKPEPPRRKLEALIVGFRTDSDGRLSDFILAADRFGELMIIGTVRPEMERREATELVMKMRENTAAKPFVRTSESGSWLPPRYMCRVTYAEWPEQKGKRPKDLKWDTMLDELKLPW